MCRPWYVIDGELTVLVGDERVEAGPGRLRPGTQGIPHTFLIHSEGAEFVAGAAPPELVAPDSERFASRAADSGIEIVGPPPTLDEEISRSWSSMSWASSSQRAPRRSMRSVSASSGTGPSGSGSGHSLVRSVR